MLIWPFPWEITHTHICQKPIQTKIKGSLNSRHELILAPCNRFQKQLISPGDVNGVMLQVHDALWGVLNTHKKHPGSLTPGAGSRVSLPSWMEDPVGDQAGHSGIREMQGGTK